MCLPAPLYKAVAQHSALLVPSMLRQNLSILSHYFAAIGHLKPFWHSPVIHIGTEAQQYFASNQPCCRVQQSTLCDTSQLSHPMSCVQARVFMLLQALAIALLAYATLAHKPSTEWLKSCVDHALSIVSDFDAQAVANAVWALSFMDYLPPLLWCSLMEPFEAACKGLNGRLAIPCCSVLFALAVLLLLTSTFTCHSAAETSSHKCSFKTGKRNCILSQWQS